MANSVCSSRWPVKKYQPNNQNYVSVLIKLCQNPFFVQYNLFSTSMTLTHIICADELKTKSQPWSLKVSPGKEKKSQYYIYSLQNIFDPHMIKNIKYLEKKMFSSY